MQVGGESADVPERDALDPRGRTDDPLPAEPYKIKSLGSMLGRVPGNETGRMIRTSKSSPLSTRFLSTASGVSFRFHGTWRKDVSIKMVRVFSKVQSAFMEKA